MSEFQIEQWCDFARGVVEAELGAQMLRELESGDQEAADMLACFRRVGDLALSDRELAPPDFALEGAKSLFDLRRPTRPGMKRRLASLLVFDSGLQPAVAGLRRSGEEARRLRYSGGGVAVEMRMEPAASRGGIIVGEIVEEGDDGEPLRDVVLLANDGERVLGHAVSRELGEFEIQVDDLRAPKSVRAVLRDRTTVTFDLPDSRQAEGDGSGDLEN